MSGLQTRHRHVKPSYERATFGAWVFVSAVLALMLQTAFFRTTDWISGDLAYHRGVAYSMVGGDVQGSGPFAGLISYFGGLFPLTAAVLFKAVGWSFETSVSYASWVAPLLLVAAFGVLGRALWPDDGFRSGLLVFLGTAAGTLTPDQSNVWVDGLLPGLHNYWPAYPRDIALALFVLASATALAESRYVRALVTSFALAGAFLFQAQIGGIGCLIVVAIWAAEVLRGTRRARTALGDSGLAALMFLLATGWWLWPRLLATARSGLRLESFPRVPPPSTDLLSLVDAFGVVGLLALLGIGLRVVKRSVWRPTVTHWMTGWLSVTLPIAIVGSIGGDIGVLTDRRGWLLVSPFLLVASVEAIGWLRSLGRPHLFRAVFVTLLALAVVPSAIATSNRLHGLWPAGQFQGRILSLDAWTPVWSHLREAIASGSHPSVLASDVLSGPIWTGSGSHIASMVLPGYFKVGFGLEEETGWSYLERVASVHEAFQTGLPGVCELAGDRDMTHILLEQENGMLSTRDVNPAGLYRVDLASKSPETIRRDIGPGIRYLDSNSLDSLSLSSGAIYRMPKWASSVDALDIELFSSPAVAPAVSVRHENGEHLRVTSERGGFNRLRLPLPADGGAIEFEVHSRVRLLRIIGFEQHTGLSTSPVVSSGNLALYESSQLCDH